MSADYIEKALVHDRVDDLHVTTFVDKPHWQIDVERYKECRQVQALIFSIKEPPVHNEYPNFPLKVQERLAAKREMREKKRMKALMKEDYVEDMEKHPLFPALYLIHISAKRKLITEDPVRGLMVPPFYRVPDASTGELPVECGVWAFSGLLRKPGDMFSVRVDSIVENIKKKGMAPHEFFLTVRILGLFSLQFYDHFYTPKSVIFGKDRRRAWLKERPLKVETKDAENPADFEESLILLLEMLHSGKVDRINVKNIGRLCKTAKRYEFHGIFSRLECHLIDICSETPLREKLNAALMIAEEYEMKDATVLREAQQQATVNSASHLYFRCDEHGKFIIQLNRVALPKMVDLVIKQFSDRNTPQYDWNEGELHSSTLADERFFTGEEAGKESVPPAGTWAFILRKEKDGSARFGLTKERPTKRIIYIEYVVKGRKKIVDGASVTQTGVYYFAV